MSRKSPIISLGRSKSHKRTCTKENQETQFLSHNISWRKDKSHHPNYSNHFCSNQKYRNQHLEKTKSMNMSSFCTNKNSKQKILREFPTFARENRYTSPSKVIVNQPNPRLHFNTSEEVHHIRKIEALEKRIQQVHQDKQLSIMNLHKEYNKTLAQNQYLKNIIKRNNLNVTNPNNNTEHINPKRSLKNIAYIDDSEDCDCTSFANLNKKQMCEENASISSEERKKYQQQIKQLQEENTNLNRDLEEMKDAVLQTTEMIQQNNNKIVEEYQLKILQLHEKMEEKQKNNVEEFKKMEQQVKQLQNQLLRKSEELSQTSQQLEQNTFKRELLESGAGLEQNSSKFQSCQRCKELIKSLVKLNKKTFTKTM